jgi:NitT/TauT family transport system substrate-binding protein
VTAHWLIVAPETGFQKTTHNMEEIMPAMFRRLAATFAALMLSSGLALAQSKVTLAVGGGSCLCYLPTMLAQALGEYEKAGVNVEIVDFKGGSESLKAVIGGSADVVSGYFDHCVNLAAKGQHLQSFVVYDRYPGFALVVSPKQTSAINSIKDLANKKVGVSAPGSSTDFFLKYMLSKNGVDPNSVGVIGVGLGATAIAAMEQGTIDAAIMLDPAVTILQGQNKDLKILSDTRSQKDTLAVFGGEYPGGALYTRAEWIASHENAGDDQCDHRNLEMDPFAYPGGNRRQDAGEPRRQGQGAIRRRAQEYAAHVFRNRPHGSQGRSRGARGVQPVVAGGGQGQYRSLQNLYQQVRGRSEQDDRNEVICRKQISGFGYTAGISPPCLLLSRP